MIRLQSRTLRNAHHAHHAHHAGSTLFDSHHLLIDPEEPNCLHIWVDVVFASLDSIALWNAAFITTAMAKSDLASSQACDQIDARL